MGLKSKTFLVVTTIILIEVIVATLILWRINTV